MVSAGFFTCFSLFLVWGGFFLHLFADLSIPLFPQITCLTFYDLKFCPFFQKLESEKEKERKEKGGKISQHKPNKNPTPNQQTKNPLTPYPYFLNPTYYLKIQLPMMKNFLPVSENLCTLWTLIEQLKIFQEAPNSPIFIPLATSRYGASRGPCALDSGSVTRKTCCVFSQIAEMWTLYIWPPFCRVGLNLCSLY